MGFHRPRFLNLDHNLHVPEFLQYHQLRDQDAPGRILENMDIADAVHGMALGRGTLTCVAKDYPTDHSSGYLRWLSLLGI